VPALETVQTLERANANAGAAGSRDSGLSLHSFIGFEETTQRVLVNHSLLLNLTLMAPLHHLQD
jgi:hypothetical protein